jgi:hypothetical protein
MPRREKSRTGCRAGRTGCSAAHRQCPDSNAQPATTGTDAIVLSQADPAGPSAGEPRNHRELAQAIFAKCDAVKVGRELLESSGEKGASVRARMFEMLADWQFGTRPQAAEPAHPRIRFIWTIPGPPRESEIPPESEPSEDE